MHGPELKTKFATFTVPLRRWLFSVLLAIGWLIGNVPIASADDVALHSQLDQIDATLKEVCKTNPLAKEDSCDFLMYLDAGDEKVSGLWGQMRDLVEQRALQFLEVNGSSSPDSLAQIIRYDDMFDANVVKLDSKSLLVSFDYQAWQSDVFIAGEKNGHAAVIWRLRDVSASELRKFPDLTVWAPPSVQNEACRKIITYATFGDGPCTLFAPADIVKLPDSMNGDHRFYVDAERVQEASCFHAEQLSFWEWKGQTVSPVLAKTFPVTCDPLPFQTDGTLMHVNIDRGFRAIGTFAEGTKRETDWKIGVEANSIKDLGETAKELTMALIDDTLYRVAHKVDATKLASPAAIAFLKRNLTAPGETLAIESYRTAVSPAGKIYCLDLDTYYRHTNGNGIYAFTIAKRGKSALVARVRELNESSASKVCPA